MNSLLHIVGARPQFIKLAMIFRALCHRPGLTQLVLHTGQHYDTNLSQDFFNDLELPKPAINLGVGSVGTSIQCARMLEGICHYVQRERPRLTVLYGDTNSTLAGALAATQAGIPVAHVEAGMRCGNLYMPEEINRVVTDHLSEILFCASETARANLVNEGLGSREVHVVGDIMLDCFNYERARRPLSLDTLARYGLDPKGYILVTIHRAENTDDKESLESILSGLALVAATQQVLLPLHPRTRARIMEEPQLGRHLSNLKVIDPVGYHDMLTLESYARVIATDSGGVQKEAFYCGVPCVLLRGTTEWRELVDLGAAILGNCKNPLKLAGQIVDAAHQQWESSTPYGTGNAANAIAEVLVRRVPS